VSRLPRSQEHLKTAFTAEAASAARFRAYAVSAERDEKPALAERWRRLAGDKDRLAGELLEAAGKGLDAAGAGREAIAEERYENEVLYARMIGEVDEETAARLEWAVEEQRDHLSQLEALRRELQAARGDVGGQQE
jgi:rubrerythrin